MVIFCLPNPPAHPPARLLARSPSHSPIRLRWKSCHHAHCRGGGVNEVFGHGMLEEKLYCKLTICYAVKMLTQFYLAFPIKKGNQSINW